MRYDLFNPPSSQFFLPNNHTENVRADLLKIKGLKYIPGFLTKLEHNVLLAEINKEVWLTDLKRRVQHFGWKYDYKARGIDYSMFLGQLPSWALTIANRIHKMGYMDVIPDQLIVNEYQVGQGIAPHVDCEPCFGETIISVSLGSPAVMDFCQLNTKQKVSVLLEPKSLIILSNEARHQWTHGIVGRKVDIFHNQRIERQTRISLTFRKVTLK